MAIKFLNSVNADSGVLYVDATNNRVGIGTTSPTGVLDVLSTNDQRFVKFRAPNGEERYQFHVGGTGNSAYMRMFTDDGVTGNVQISALGTTWFNGGNVGIGTTNPGAELHIYDPSLWAQIIVEAANDGYDSSVVYTQAGVTKGITGYDDSTDTIALKYGTFSGSGIDVSSTGNVGIGTTSPSYKLHVQGSNNGNINTIVENTNAGTNAYATYRLKNNSISTAALFLNGSNNTAYSGANSLNMYQGGNHPLGFVTSNQTRMTVTGGGNVGIGTTSPSEKLEVIGNIQVGTGVDTNSKIAFTRNGGANVGAIGWHWDNAFYVAGHPSHGSTAGNIVRVYGFGSDVRLGDNSNGDVLTVDYSNGNVGIGTTSPGSSLHVAGAIPTTPVGDGVHIGLYNGNYGHIQLQGSSGAYIDFSASGTDWKGRILYDNSSNFMRFDTSANERMRITASGNVGIGTTSPASTLHVSSTSPIITISNSDTSLVDGQVIGQVDFKSLDGSSNMTDVFGSIRTEAQGTLDNGVSDGGKMVFSTFKQSTTLVDQMVIDRDGNVGIGTTSPDYKLEINSDSTSGVMSVKNAANGRDTFRSENAAGTRTFNIGNDASGHGIVLVRNSSGTTTSYIAGGGNSYFNGGNVGIGTASPSEKLHVVGDTRIEGNLTVNGTYTQIDTDTNTTEQWNVTNDGTGPAVTINQTGAQDIMDVQDDGTSVFYIEDGGNVGIGTTDPDTKLEISGASGQKIRIKSTKSSLVADELVGAFEAYKTDGSTNGAGVFGSMNIYSQDLGGASYVTLNTSASDGNNVERLRIKSNGSVLLSSYGNNNFTGTAAYALAVDSSGNVIETSYIPSSSSTDFVAVTGDTMSGNLILNDNVELRLGTSSDFKAGHTGSYTYMYNYTGHMYLRNFADNSDIIFQTDDGSGGYASYFTLDGSTGHAYFSNYGNVGIGTSSPNAPLHIQEAVDSLTTVKGITLSTSAGGTNKYLPAIVWSYGANGTPDFAKIEAQRGSGTSGRIAFSTANSSGTMSEAIRIDGDGNVGIGTTSPDYKLEVVGNLGLTQSSTVAHLSGNSSGNLTISNTTGQINFLANGSTVTSMWITSSGITLNENVDINYNLIVDGNVGIGTTSPGAKLDITTDHTSQIPIRVTHNNYNDWLIQKRRSDDTQKLGIKEVNSNGGMGFATADAVRMVIDSSGNVGIGATSPLRKLHVVGNFAVNAGTGEYYGVNITGGEGANPTILIGDWHNASANLSWDSTNRLLRIDAQYSTSGAPIVFSGNDAAIEYMRITSAGNVGIGTTNPIDELHVEGVIQSKKQLLPSTGSTAGWYKIGTLEGFVQGGATAVIEIAGHQGYNATNNQDYLIKLFIKTSNGNAGGPNGQGFNSWYERTGGNSATIEFKWDNSATNDYDLYMFIPTHSLRSWYSVKKGTGTWEHSGTSATDPGANSASVLKATSLFNILDTNVGIGTTSPASKLHVKSGGGNSYVVRGMSSAGTDLGGLYQSTSGDGEIYLKTSAVSTNVRISSNTVSYFNGGNVGIGTTNPLSKLHVSDATNISMGSGGEGQFRVEGSGYTGAIALDGTAMYIYHNSASRNLVLGTNETAAITIHQSNQTLTFNAYGAGYLKTDASGNVTVDTSTIEDTLDSVTDRGSTTTNDIEVGNITTKNDSGIYSFSDTVDASASEDIFSISNQHGAQAFRVTFVCSTSGYSVAKTYEVVHAYATDPVFFKVVDTGAFGNHDFDVSFTNDATDDTKVVCEITNNSTAINANIVSTVFLGGSPTTITVTAL